MVGQERLGRIDERRRSNELVDGDVMQRACPPEAIRARRRLKAIPPGSPRRSSARPGFGKILSTVWHSCYCYLNQGRLMRGTSPSEKSGLR
jgi:hypothetical protein